MVPEQKPTIDERSIRRDLETMTARWGELNEPVKFEIRAFAEHKSPQVARYSPDWIEEAVDWCQSLNALGYNIYAVRNPIRADAPSGGAKDADIAAAFYLWADCDDATAAANVRNFVGPKWSWHVLTGTIPSTRVHVYWELDQPIRDLDAWRQMQMSIAATFESDRAVINPSRIMRVGGTVAYPFEQKRGRGYVPELCQIKTDYPDARGTVAFDRMAQLFKPAPASAKFEIDTGEFSAPLDRERLAIQAKEGKEWHHAVIRLVASYVAKGLSDGEIHGLTQPLTLAGYTAEQTRAEVQTAIDGARAKGWTPEPQAAALRDLTPAEVEAIPPALFRPWAVKDLTAIPYPHFVYSDFYARGYTSVTLAPPKVGKSMLGLAEAIDIATGRGFLTGVQREPQSVVYYNAEDDQDVIDSRVAALLTEYKIPQDEIVGRLYATSGVDASDFYMVSGQEGVVNEALFVSIEKFIAESGAAALIFDPLQDLSRSPETNEVFRLLGQRLRRMASTTGVALGLIHHTRKIAPNTTPTIDDGRGGSALRGTARFNRLLIGMTEDEGAKAGVDNHRHYLRIGDMESNLAPPSSDLNRWFEKTSVITPNGHSVGAIRPWEWPDAFDGISRQDAARVRSEVGAMDDPPRADVRSAAWVGVVVADALGIDLTTTSGKAKVKAIVGNWINTDVLRVTEGRDNRAGRSVKVVIAGDNNPLSEVSA